MEYQKIINLFQNTPNHPSKFRTRSWAEVNRIYFMTFIIQQLNIINNKTRSLNIFIFFENFFYPFLLIY